MRNFDNIQGFPKKSFKNFLEKTGEYIPKFSLNYKISYLKIIGILSSIAKKLQALKFLQNCSSKKVSGSKKKIIISKKNSRMENLWTFH